MGSPPVASCLRLPRSTHPEERSRRVAALLATGLRGFRSARWSPIGPRFAPLSNYRNRPRTSLLPRNRAAPDTPLADLKLARFGPTYEWHVEVRKLQGDRDIGNGRLLDEDGVQQPIGHRHGGYSDAAFSPEVVPPTGALPAAAVPPGRRPAVHRHPHRRRHHPRADHRHRLVGPDLLPTGHPLGVPRSGAQRRPLLPRRRRPADRSSGGSGTEAVLRTDRCLLRGSQAVARRVLLCDRTDRGGGG